MVHLSHWDRQLYHWHRNCHQQDRRVINGAENGTTGTESGVAGTENINTGTEQRQHFKQLADLVLEVIMSKLQPNNFIMQAFQEVVEALQLHALLAVFAKEVEEQPSVVVPVRQS